MFEGFLIVISIIALYFSIRYAWWKPAVDYHHPRILMYHQITNPIIGARYNGLRVSPQMFEQQLSWLQENDWNFVTMRELLEKKDNHPPKTVAITFDDGYEDNFLQALPLIKKYHAKATVYVVLERHDNDWSSKKKKHHDSGELMRDSKLTDEQIQKMITTGLIEIASHTITHANLDRIDEQERQNEIANSRKALENQFDIKVSSFAYPFGIYQNRDVKCVLDSGYLSAVTTIEGIDRDLMNPFELKRIKISGKDNFFTFKIKMKTGRRGW